MTIRDDDDDEARNYKFRVPEDEGPDVRDIAGDELEFVRCPHCRKYIPEEAPKCPYCRNWVTHGKSRKPMWFVFAAVLCLIAALMWVIFG